MLIFFAVFQLLAKESASGLETIILKNQTEFICVTNNINSPIYVQPLTEETPKNTSILLHDVKWSLDDWLLKNSTDILQHPVLDKRWEDFGITHTSYQIFEKQKSLSFSLHGPTFVKFYLRDEEYVQYYNKTANHFSWIHFTIHLKNDATHIYENDELVRVKTNLNPTKLVVRSEEKFFMRTHNYQIRVANKVSTNPTSIEVSPNEVSCLMLYVSLCTHCQLNVSFSDKFELFSNQDRGLTQEWQELKISITSKLNITMLRTTINNENDGFWAVDIRKCPTMVSDRVIYRTSISAENSPKRCQTLGAVNGNNSTSVSSSDYSSVKSTCDAGFFGSDCQLSCADILGPNKRYCEGYEICDNDSSNCYKVEQPQKSETLNFQSYASTNRNNAQNNNNFRFGSFHFVISCSMYLYLYSLFF